MLYSLSSSKVIEISVEQYLDMTDEEFEYLISINYGESVENPFFGSVLNRGPVKIEEECIQPVDQVIDVDVDFIPEEE